MTINLVHDLWTELRNFIGPMDRSPAAALLVSVMIDHDYDAEEIKSAFKTDNDIKAALESYLDDAVLDEEEEEIDEYDDNDDKY